MALLTSPWLHGMHDPGGEKHFKDKPSWIVFTEEIGSDPSNRSGKDFRPWTDKGFWPIVRLNNGYGSTGTIPTPDRYGAFAERCARYVEASQGRVLYWIIGNEPNHEQERPNGQPISPEQYASCYLMARQAIKQLSNHRGDVIMPAAVAPWTTATLHWIEYFRRLLAAIRGNCDAINLHTYTHGPELFRIYANHPMGGENSQWQFEFRTYKDFLAQVPAEMRYLPCLITEMTQVKPGELGWWNQPNAWIQTALREIDQHNKQPGVQTIQAACAYRYPKAGEDMWWMVGKEHVLQDFEAAVDIGFRAPQPMPMPVQVKPIPKPVTPTQPSPAAELNLDTFIRMWTRIFKVEERAMRALLDVESGGRSFEGNRMIIRFENHVFHMYLNRLAPALLPEYPKYFQHGSPPQTQHRWRPTIASEWLNCHVLGQAGEWSVFDFARRIHETAAMYAISMGSGQVMGLNFGKLSYPSVQAMFQDFNTPGVGAYHQIAGVFAYIVNTEGLLQALREKNWWTVARLYNGIGQEEYYSKLMIAAYARRGS